MMHGRWTGAIDHTRRVGRRYIACAAGLVGIEVFPNTPVRAFTALVLAVAGPISGNMVFWTMPPMLLAGTTVFRAACCNSPSSWSALGQSWSC